jgi:hypothetical protein
MLLFAAPSAMPPTIYPDVDGRKGASGRRKLGGKTC